jgi:putative (di)nucleoside polyphosphate hydrolase
MSLPLRPNVAVVVFDQSNRVLLCKRKKIGTDQIAENRFSDYWQFPQGGIDQGEDIYITAKRELAEETGITTGEVLSCSSEEFSYDWTHGPRYLTGNPLKFRGQKQKLCYFKFTGNYNEIKLDNNEFVDYKWCVEHEFLFEYWEFNKSNKEKIKNDIRVREFLLGRN